MLKALAEAVLSEEASADALDLRVADVLNAAFSGLAAREGQLLLGRFDLNTPEGQAGLVSALVRMSETDDIHLAACVTPGSVVIPVALAMAAADGEKTTKRFPKAVAAGYAAGLRMGAAIGGARAMDTGVWPTLAVASLMAATTASVLRGGDVDALANAMALSVTGISGRLGRPTGVRTSRWLSFGRATAAGVAAEADAASGLVSDPSIVTEAWLAAQSSPDIVDASALSRTGGPTMADAGFKPFATARQGAPAIMAFMQLLDEEGIDPDRIDAVTVEVPTGNLKLVARPLNLADRLSTLSSAAYQLAAAAVEPDLLFDTARLAAPGERMMALAGRIEARAATDLDATWPRQWAGRVVVRVAGREFTRETIALPTDAGQAGVEALVRAKIARMAGYRPAGISLQKGSCVDAAGRNAIWSELLARCEAGRDAGK